MSGCDLLGIAKNGSGKTLAVLLAMLKDISDQPELEERDGQSVGWTYYPNTVCTM